MIRNAAPRLTLVLLLAAGCALYSDVSILPLNILPSNIDRGADMASMIRKADFLRAIEMAPVIDRREKQDAAEMAALGSAYLAAGRFDEARTRLRAALDLNPFRTTYATTAWDLAQVEYLSNNFETSLDWAEVAMEHGMIIRDWHLEYLRALSHVQVYQFHGDSSERLPFRFGRPDVPRIEVMINGTKSTEAIIDSGAVTSIISQRLASSLPIRSLGTFEGTFFGLLGEPIAVHFGLIDSLQLGGIRIDNVPVAIMPDEKMRFLISRKADEEFRMDFLLGTNLLKEFRLELNFDKSNAIFTRLTAADHKADANQNLFYDGFRPHVRAAINRRGWFLFILDTGSEITFLNEARLKSLPVTTFSSKIHTAMLQGLGGATKRGGKLENIEIGVDEWSGVFKTLPMYASSDKEQAVGIIGQNYLKNFDVIIDFGTMRVDLKRR
ncbi:MAG: hypothetical protein QOH21_562 [Acidobacteriota bacterium]|jgi:tetratricopeptide (TPR) repeat protein|nr:hypothetical protein [Acidobacteriota bacterium]